MTVFVVLNFLQLLKTVPVNVILDGHDRYLIYLTVNFILKKDQACMDYNGTDIFRRLTSDVCLLIDNSGFNSRRDLNNTYSSYDLFMDLIVYNRPSTRLIIPVN